MIKKLVVGTLLALILLAIPKLSVSTQAAADKNVIVLSKDNLLILNSEIDGDSAGKLILKARELDAIPAKGLLNKKKEHIFLYLKTPGGRIDSGDQIKEVLQGLERPVDTITYFAASMGFDLVQSLGERLVLRSGTLMSHHARGGVEGEYGGLPGQMDSRFAFLQQTIREMDELTVKRTNGKQTYESYIKSYDHELWKTAATSVKEGYADRIVTIRCDKSLSGTTSHQATILGIIPVTYEIDNCPINQEPMNISLGKLPTGITREMAESAKTQFLQTYEKNMRTPRPMVF